jgi:hypothetical protein
MGSPDPIALEDWKGRGITPIAYDATNSHAALRDTLKRWASLSAINGKRGLVDSEIRRIVKTSRADAPDADRDLFDHLFRRGSTNERIRLAAVANKGGAEVGWIDAVAAILAESERV